jgi:hypothetical protein
MTVTTTRQIGLSLPSRDAPASTGCAERIKTGKLSRWALSYNYRSQIYADTHGMYIVCNEDNLTHNEAKPGRQTRDQDNENSLMSTLQQFTVFAPEVHPTSLHNIATKDLATDQIQESLLNAAELGKEQVDKFERQASIRDGPAVSFHSAVRRNNAPTFDTLYEVVKDSKDKDKTTVLKADRSILQRLVIAYEAGRQVDLQSVLKHELVYVPVSLAEMNWY